MLTPTPYSVQPGQCPVHEVITAPRRSGRYPYTFACDFVRAGVDDYDAELGMRVTTISRSQASLAIGVIASALGMTKEALAEKLADAYLAHEDTIVQQALSGKPAQEGE